MSKKPVRDVFGLWQIEGVKKHTLISVGVLGGYRDKDAQYYFEKGFYEMLKILEPIKIITYGKLPDYLEFDCKQKKIDIISFPTEISKRYPKIDNRKQKLDLRYI